MSLPFAVTRVTVALLAGGTLVLAAHAAHAQKALRPNVLVVFDTSGSMQLNQTGAWAGENTNICPSASGSRIYALKKALRDTLAQVGTDEANFGLMSFPSVEDATLAVTTGNSGCFQCASEGCAAATKANGWVGHYYVTQNSRYGCTMEGQPTKSATTGAEDAYGGWFDTGLPQVLRVGVTANVTGKPTAGDFDPNDGNIGRVYEWIDNVEQPAGAAAITNHELHANGATPLGRSLFYARYYFQEYVKAKNASSGKPLDPMSACRQNIVILVTDGNDSCDNTTGAGTIDFASCTFNNYATYHPAQQACHLYKDAGVKTYVLTDSTVTGSLNNNIALAGGTGSALRVSLTDSNAVKAAILGIIAKTVPPAEQCNGVDDNCNGIIDEDVSNGYAAAKCGNPVPAPDPSATQKSPWNQCMADDPTLKHCAIETCNCADDDFDDTTDEGLTPNACGQPCGCLVPPEKCDGQDNNCDGQVDELFNVGTPCSNMQLGACFRQGLFECNASGSGTACSAPAVDPTGLKELCNNIDDDCNGLTDDAPVVGEGTPCGSQGGLCSAGHLVCSAGKLVCTSTTIPKDELCNGLDDDCNGITDDGNKTIWPWLNTPCYCGETPEKMQTGECRPGTWVCKNQQLCEGCIGPVAEVCDGKDNDCDGVIDNGQNPCGSSRFRCSDGRCLLLCSSDEFPCPSGYKCEGDFCIPQRCNGVVCYPDEKCDDETGKCVDLCHGIQCQTPSFCDHGVCVTCYDPGYQCPSGQLCVAGVCKEDRCAGLTCSKDEYCVDSGEASGARCVRYCETVQCPGGQRCVQGECRTDPCSTKVCGTQEYCDPTTAECKHNPCTSRICVGGKICVPTTGMCAANPCDTIQCGECFKCAITVEGQGSCVVDENCDAYHVSTGTRGSSGKGCAVAGTSPTGDALVLGVVALLPFALRRRRSTGRL